VATSVLAKQFNLNGSSLARYLRESGTPLLAIPLPDAGKSHAFFLSRDVAVRTQLPSRRLLRKLARLHNQACKNACDECTGIVDTPEMAGISAHSEKSLGRSARRQTLGLFQQWQTCRIFSLILARLFKICGTQPSFALCYQSGHFQLL
jgi:hypothetical protein